MPCGASEHGTQIGLPDVRFNPDMSGFLQRPGGSGRIFQKRPDFGVPLRNIAIVKNNKLVSIKFSSGNLRHGKPHLNFKNVKYYPQIIL